LVRIKQKKERKKRDTRKTRRGKNGSNKKLAVFDSLFSSTFSSNV